MWHLKLSNDGDLQGSNCWLCECVRVIGVTIQINLLRQCFHMILFVLQNESWESCFRIFKPLIWVNGKRSVDIKRNFFNILLKLACYPVRLLKHYIWLKCVPPIWVSILLLWLCIFDVPCSLLWCWGKFEEILKSSSMLRSMALVASLLFAFLFFQSV